MPSDKKRIVTYVTDEEYQRIVQSAEQAGISLSTFVKRVCLGNIINSTVDHQAVLAVMKANADLGRLGGLFKMFLSEGKAEQNADELRAILRGIEAAKSQVVKTCNMVAQALTHKKKRGVD